MSFDLGTASPANWNLMFWNTIAMERAIPAIVPPRAFTFDWSQAPSDVSVLVSSQLDNSSGQIMCAEWTTVSTGP